MPREVQKWSTYNCIYGWELKGIWPPSSRGDDINAVDRSHKGDVIISGDDFSNLKVFKYPCP